MFICDVVHDGQGGGARRGGRSVLLSTHTLVLCRICGGQNHHTCIRTALNNTAYNKTGGGGFNALKTLSNNQSLVSHSSCRVMRWGLFTFSLLERTNQSIFMAICPTLPGARGGGKQVSSSRKRSFILIFRLHLYYGYNK